MAGKPNLEIHIRILQNGHPVAECTRNVSKGLAIELTSDYKGDLSLPLYPMSANIELFFVEKGQLFLHLDQAWAGFYTSHGDVRNIHSFEREARQIPLTVNDYGSISLKDLRLLFKIRPKSATAAKWPAMTKGYSSKPLDLFLSGRLEWTAVMGSSLIAAIILGFVWMAVGKAKIHRPHAFEELDAAYMLPFVNADHVRLIPEAMRGNLDRSNYLGSTIIYYRALAAALSGWFEGKQDKFLPATTVARYSALHEDHRGQKETVIANQSERSKTVLNDAATAMVVIPSVLGESVDQGLARMLRKVDISHESMRLNLAYKRKIAGEFPKDESYDWISYQNGTKTNQGSQDFLARVSVFGEMTNEEHMYSQADLMAKSAETIQAKLFGKSHDGPAAPLRSDLSFIQIDSGIDFASFLTSPQILANNEKMGQIRASSFDRQRKETIKEPLIGAINPNLVQKVLAKNQFQLQLCYELALRRNQQTRGSMDWQWRIDTRGKISDIVLRQSSISDRQMVECVRAKMALWQFPRPQRGSVEINHSFQFSPQKG